MPDLDHQPAHSSTYELLRHPMTTVLVSFVLTGVIGVWLAAQIQKRAETTARRSEIRESRRSSALAVADTVGVFLNRTTYLFGEYWDAIYQGLPQEEASKRRLAFDSARAAFESRRYVDAARVEVHFGSELRALYEGIADSLQFLVGNFQIVQRRPARGEDFKPSVLNVQRFTSCLLLQLVRAADSVATMGGPAEQPSAEHEDFRQCMESR